MEIDIAPETRGQGVGRRLLGFALGEAAQPGIGTLHLELETDNARTTQLYRSAGFEETGRQLMRRRLRAG